MLDEQSNVTGGGQIADDVDRDERTCTGRYGEEEGDSGGRYQPEQDVAATTAHLCLSECTAIGHHTAVGSVELAPGPKATCTARLGALQVGELTAEIDR